MFNTNVGVALVVDMGLNEIQTTVLIIDIVLSKVFQKRVFIVK
jgi:hypothetical protein